MEDTGGEGNGVEEAGEDYGKKEKFKKQTKGFIKKKFQNYSLD